MKNGKKAWAGWRPRNPQETRRFTKGVVGEKGEGRVTSCIQARDGIEKCRVDFDSKKVERATSCQ